VICGSLQWCCVKNPLSMPPGCSGIFVLMCKALRSPCPEFSNFSVLDLQLVLCHASGCPDLSIEFEISAMPPLTRLGLPILANCRCRWCTLEICYFHAGVPRRGFSCAASFIRITQFLRSLFEGECTLLLALLVSTNKRTSLGCRSVRLRRARCR
jgi:hypothetical protein